MITAMIIAWAAVGVLLVGLPLAAWWVGGRRTFWSRAEARQLPDGHGEMVRRHGLGPADVAQVTGALSWGRELQDPRLRAAVVDWGEAGRAEHARWRAEHPRAAALQSWLLGLWGLLTLAGVVFAVAQDRWGSVPWFAVLWWCSGPVLGVLRRLALDRAIERNSGPGRADRATGGADAQRE